MRLCGYLVALEALRRGLDVRFHRSGGPFGDWVPDHTSALATLYSIRSGDRVHWFHRSLGDANSRQARAVTPRKTQTKRLLRRYGVSTPQGVTFKDRHSREHVLRKLDVLGGPLVIKPLYGSGGRRVVCGLSSRDTLERTIHQLLARPTGRQYIAERHVTGVEYRVFVVGDRVVAASQRWPAHVVGDGRRTIRTLIEDKNYQRTCNPHLSYRLIRMDRSLREFLDEEGLTLQSVPPLGTPVVLRRAANLSLGGEAREMLGELAPAVEQAAVAAVEAIPGLAHGGVDLIVDEATGVPVVLEVNCRPSLGVHVFPADGMASDVPAAIVDHYFPETAGCRNDRIAFDPVAVRKAFASPGVETVPVAPLSLPTAGGRSDSIVGGALRQVRVRIRGRIRGIDESVWARNLALRKGLTGSTSWRFDGSLELVLAGPEDAMEEVLEVIQRGPKRAQGWEVAVSAASGPLPVGFRVHSEGRLRRIRRRVGRWRRAVMKRLQGQPPATNGEGPKHESGMLYPAAEALGGQDEAAITACTSNAPQPEQEGLEQPASTMDAPMPPRAYAPSPEREVKVVPRLKNLQLALQAAVDQKERLSNQVVERLIRRCHRSGRSYRAMLEAQQRLVYKLHAQGKRKQARRLYLALRHGLYIRGKAHVAHKGVALVSRSFRMNLARQEEFNHHLEQSLQTPALPRLCRKLHAYRFATRLGVDVPAVYQSGVPLESVEPRERFVVKPESHRGAVGVCGLMAGDGCYRDVFRGDGGTWAEVHSRLTKIMKRKRVRDRWMTEELILRNEDTGEPSDDFKFYMFYGRIGCILHIRRWPQRVQRWYGAEWEPLETGKYTESESDELAPPPAAEALASAAVQLSAAIPQPFVRVDLLSDGSRAVLNELTRAPGDYDAFADDFDQHLGELWRDAEARLYRDLVAGVAFPAYRAVLHLDESGGA